VLLLVGNVLKGQKVDPYNLTPAQQTAVKTALETNKVDNWLARKYRKTQADKEEVRDSSSSSSSSRCSCRDLNSGHSIQITHQQRRSATAA
jgi:hypothetical protein